MFWKKFHLILMHFLFLIFNALGMFSKIQFFFFLKKNKEFFQIFDWFIVFFDQLKLLLKFLVRLCLVRLIEPVFRSIKHRESSFLKTQFWLVQTSFQNFSKFFFLSPTRQGSTEIFCRFPPKFLQSFSLPKPICLFYPSFCIVFLIFMHNLMVFGYFSNYA